MTSKNRVLITLFAATVAFAASVRGETGPYIGGAVGQTRAEVGLGDVGGAGFRIDDEDFAYKVFFGYDLPGPLAIEGGYRDLGRVTDENALVRATSESDGFDAFAVGRLPVGPVALFAKGGLIAWDTEVESRSKDGLGLPDVRATASGTDFAWGVGLSVDLGKVGIRGEFEKFEVDVPDDLTMLSVGVTFAF